MTSDQRKQRLDGIRGYADHLTELARRYDRLRYVAERDDATDAFIDLVDAAGKMTVASLRQLADLLELLRKANND